MTSGRGCVGRDCGTDLESIDNRQWTMVNFGFLAGFCGCTAISWHVRPTVGHDALVVPAVKTFPMHNPSANSYNPRPPRRGLAVGDWGSGRADIRKAVCSRQVRSLSPVSLGSSLAEGACRYGFAGKTRPFGKNRSFPIYKAVRSWYNNKKEDTFVRQRPVGVPQNVQVNG